MSNFESAFVQFLHTVKISRSAKQHLLQDGKSFSQFILVRFPDEKHISLTKMLRPSVLQEYFDWVKKKYRSKKRTRTTQQIFSEFHTYITHRQTLMDSTVVLPPTLQEILLSFLASLSHDNVPDATIRNYKSDILQFFGYLNKIEKTLSFLSSRTLPPEICDTFSVYLTEELNLSPASVKRKLSSFRSFLRWGQRTGSFFSDTPISSPAEEPTDYINPYESIQNEINKDQTIPPPAYNHVVQTRSWAPYLLVLLFICGLTGISLWWRWNEQRQTTPTSSEILISTPVPADDGISLRYEGRIATAEGASVSDIESIRFRIWDNKEKGSLLYDSGICHTTIDKKSIFSIEIGSECGRTIPPSLFHGSLPLYIGVSVDDGEEMSPRQEIATTALSKNSQTLSGHEAQNPVGPGGIPFIDTQGKLAIAASSPILTSTKGVFTIEGRTLTLQTKQGSGGSINLSPDSGGTLNVVFRSPITTSSPGFATIANPNILSGSLLHMTGSPLTSGYNFLELVSGDSQTKQFSVDAGGNTSISGDLHVQNSLEASSSGVLVHAPLVLKDQIYDGGLGIFGTKGEVIPISSNLTEPTRIEFSFKTGHAPVVIDTNLSKDEIKFYRAMWSPDNTMTVSACTPTCQILGTSPLTWSTDRWHHGMISYTKDSIKWDIDTNKARVQSPLSSNVPLLTAAYLRFTQGVDGIANLRISQTEDTILSAGDSSVGGNIHAKGSVISEGQIQTGRFSNAPNTVGDGAIYFNTSDHTLYYWNGTNWISDTYWTKSGDTLAPVASQTNVSFGTSSSYAKLTIADTTKEQLRLVYDDTHSASFTASSSGTLDIHPTTDLQISGDVLIGNGGLLYPSENGTHQVQHQYFLSADTSAGGTIRTNALAFSAGGSDFAERFYTKESLTSGDLVIFDHTSDIPDLIKKSDQAYTGNILGVVSENASFIGGSTRQKIGYSSIIVGLLGQIPLHVSAQSGDIHSGDPITSSSIPGVGMKATQTGPILGYAMESSTWDKEGRSTVLTFVRPGWYDASVRYTKTGDLTQLPAGDIVPHGNPSITSLTAAFGTMTSLVADRASFLSSIITDLTVSQANIQDLTATVLHTGTLISDGTATINNIKTNTLAPIDSSELSIELPSSPSGFGQLSIKNKASDTVASIDAGGNATFSGSLLASDISTHTFGVSSDATVAGTLYANNLVSGDIDRLKSSVTALTHDVRALLTPTPISSPSSSIAYVPGQVAPIDNGVSLPTLTVSPAPYNLPYQDVHEFIASTSAYLAQIGALPTAPPAQIPSTITIPDDISLDTIHVIGSSTLADTSIAGQLLIDGTLLIERQTIASLTDTLSLNAKKSIAFMGGKLMIDSTGSLTTEGTLVASGGIVTDSITSEHGDISIDLSSAPPASNSGELLTTSVPELIRERVGGTSDTKLTIIGQDKNTVTTIDSMGNVGTLGTLTAKKIILDDPNSSAATLSASLSLTAQEQKEKTGIDSPALYTHGSTGAGVIPAGATSLYVYTDTITSQSLVYITPTSSTQNHTLFISDKVAGSHAVIALDTPLPVDVRFNWWVIN